MHTVTTSYQKIVQYYRNHSIFYDATRWSFLFGRKTLLHRLPPLPDYPRILEVGCGTGTNLKRLRTLCPGALLYGLDVSDDMLSVARKKLKNYGRIRLIHESYGAAPCQKPPFDLILLSYSFTMIPERTELIVDRLNSDLAPGGCIAVVDFHSTPHDWFHNWMKYNHVYLDRDLLSLLRDTFRIYHTEVKKAYRGLWSYFLFAGKKV